MSKFKDPVEIAAMAMAKRVDLEGLENESDPYVDAETALAGLREAGWRIVRTEQVQPTWVERDFRIIEEWTSS